MHRAETQRRREKQKQAFVALSCEKPFEALGYKDLFVLTGEAGYIHDFQTSLDCLLNIFLRRTSLRHCASARKSCFYGIAK